MKAKIAPFKVLFLSSWYPNKILPNNGNSAQRHAEAIRQSNDLVALHVCSGPFLKNKVYELDTFTKNNVFTIIAYYKKPSIKIFLLSELVWGYRYLKAGFMGINMAKKKLGKIDIVHHNIIYPGGLLALLLKHINNIPYLITERWSGYLPANERYYQGFFRRFMTRRIATNASMITPVSIDLKNALKDYHQFNTRYKVIPNVADIELFQNKANHRETTEQVNRKKHMLHISTLDVRFKNMTGMLRVVKEISKKRQDFEFHIICDGEAEPHIQFAEDLGLLNKLCFFHGSKSIEEISTAMKRADFFVLFSTSENFPCVLVESLAAGLPFIATRVGGIPELFSDSFGIMIESKDEEALFNAMNKMLDTYQDYDQEKMQKYARENFSYEEVGRQYHEVYSDILNNHR